MTIVFRVEHHQTKNGPYNSNGGISGEEKGHRPMPWNDGIDSRLFHHRFGFANIRQFQIWFQEKPDIVRMQSRGFMLSVYKVHGKAIKKGQRQLTFSLQRAKLIAQVPLNTVV